jgi:hypothetical protein
VWAHESGAGPRHSTTTLVLSIVGALFGGIIIGGGTVGVLWFVQSQVAPGDAPAELADESLPLAEDVLPGQLDRIMSFIENERGLEFTEDVKVQFLDDAAFAGAWFTAPPGYEPPDGPADYGATYAALGLTTNPDDYYAAEQSTSPGALMGFYDPWTDELVVRGTEWTPVVEGTAVHELTHALQDQHFDVGTMLGGTDPEADLAARAIVEGDANRVELAYYAAQDPEWQAAYDEGYNEIYGELIAAGPYDPLLEMLGSMPYWLGEAAITELAKQGNSHVDTVMGNPPTTTAEVAQINKFLEGQLLAAEPPDAPAVPDGADILDEGTLGVAFLELLHLDVQTDWFTDNYLTEWRGDRYVTWAHDDGACTVVAVRVNSTDVGAAEEYFAPWADRTGGTVEHIGDDVVLSACAAW